MNRGRWRWLGILGVTAACILISGLTTGCPFRFFLGISCPGCGMSRAALALIRGDFSAAWYYHPLIFLVPALFYSIYRCEEKEDRAGKILLSICVALFFLVWLIRLWTGHPVTAWNFEKSVFYQLKNAVRMLYIVV